MDKNGFTPNDNRTVLGMLAGEIGKSNRGRNRILAGAVFLCIVTLTMVFGISFGKAKAEYTRAVRSAGTAASACIEGADFKQYEKVRDLEYVKLAGRSVPVGEGISSEGAGKEGREADAESAGKERREASAEGADGDRRICQIQWLDHLTWEEIIKPAYTDVFGHYPAEGQELMLPVKALESLGISEPEPGMKISLKVNVGLFRTVEEEFSLCGWYTDYRENRPGLSFGYISEEKIRSWGYDMEGKSDVLICQSDSMDWRETEERLYQDVAEKGEDLKVRACNTLEGDAVSRMAGGYGMALLGAIVILGGMFFLVHNVMQISMAGDIRQMGLLNTIGATKKQIRGIYFGQIRSILIPGVMLGTLVSVFVLKIWIPGILGNQYLSSFGGAGELSVFRPGILAAAVGFAALLTAGAAAGVVRHVVNASCVESMNYMPSGKMFLSGKKHVPGQMRLSGKMHVPGQMRLSGKMHLSAGKCITCHENENEPKRSDIKQRGGRRSARSELWYMAWQNLSRNRGQFLRTILSLFLGMEVFLAAIVITKGSDYSHVIEKRPDFLIAGEFSSWGKEEGYGSEYKTRDAGEDPMETEGESLYLLAGNCYDEFSPISQEVRDRLLSLDGVDVKRSYVMEGGYMTTVMSRKGIEPLVERSIPGATDVPEKENSMLEGFGEDVIQIVKDEELNSLQRYVQEKDLPVDMESLIDGTGVLILHDHKLSPMQEKQARKSVGEPVYFKTLWQRKDSIAWDQASDEERKIMELEDTRKESETFIISGFMDNRAEGFPGIRQTWHGAEGVIYYLISEKGFGKLPTERKTLYMELNVEEKLEPQVKAQIQDIITKENRRRDRIITRSDEEMGEAGIFCISKSDLRTEAENYIRGSRRILGSVSIVLLLAGLTNFFNVTATGILARRKEFEVMESIGMTQKQELLIAEGMYYCFITGILMLTIGSGVLGPVCAYMESKLSYFAGGYPWGWTIGLIWGLAVICFLTVRLCCNKTGQVNND